MLISESESRQLEVSSWTIPDIVKTTDKLVDDGVVGQDSFGGQHEDPEEGVVQDVRGV